MTKTARGRATRGVESRFNQQVKERERDGTCGYCEYGSIIPAHL